MTFWKLLLSIILLGSSAVHAQSVLNANPGPSNNGGVTGSAILFDVEATSGVVVTGLTTATDAAPGAPFTLRVYTRDGSALGGPVATGPGSSTAGWTLRGSVPGIQGGGGISLPIALPDLSISAGRTLGVALEFVDVDPAYFGIGTAPIEIYTDSILTLRTGDARSIPFTTNGSFFSSRALVGSLIYRLADPVLDANAGPGNNGGPNDAGIFFNLQSPTGALITGLETASNADPGSTYQIDIFTRAGTALGNTVGSGPATSAAGWTFRGTVTATQGADDLSLPIKLPGLMVPASQTLGVGLVFRNAGPRYFGLGSAPTETYISPGLVLTTGDALFSPFTTTGNVFSSRALVGSLSWHPLRETLPANQGPSNNAGALGFGMYMDLVASSQLSVNALRMATSAAPNSTFQVRMYTRAGTALGSTSTTGPSSSIAGWTLHATLNVEQASTGEVSLPVSIPALQINPGETVGVGLVFDDATPAYRGTGVSSPASYSRYGLTLVTGESRQNPFMPMGNFFVSRELMGTIYFSSNDPIFENGFD